MKKYIVIIQDITWNILTYIGTYDSLKDAESEVLEFIEGIVDYDSQYLLLEELKEYPSTFNMCFDCDLYNDENDTYFMVRGFIINEKEGNENGKD